MITATTEEPTTFVPEEVRVRMVLMCRIGHDGDVNRRARTGRYERAPESFIADVKERRFGREDVDCPSITEEGNHSL
jgi:hypothetical protein